YTHAKAIEDIGLMNRAQAQLAEIALMQGDVIRATALLEEALANAQAIGIGWDIAMITALLGHLACQQQNYALAKARYRESLVLYGAFDSPNYIALCLEGFAAAVCGEGRYLQAVRLCAVAAALREQAQTPLPPTEREALEQVVATAKAAIGKPVFEEEWAAGSKLTQDEAIDYALLDVSE
ncbi:MAG: hypothetical protein M3Y76_01415, partial [Chloroflexota bacterium]|nr:hypothetical protein [Chloroflexota bacterium]